MDWFKTDAYHESRCAAQLTDPWCLKEAASLEASLEIHTETDFEKTALEQTAWPLTACPSTEEPCEGHDWDC